MGNEKNDGVADGGAEWLQCFSAFQILSAMPFVKRNSGDPVVFLLNELLIEYSFGFLFFFEELPIATFTDLWPGHTPKNLFRARATSDFGSDLYFSKFSRSFAHDRECLRNGQN